MKGIGKKTFREKGWIEGLAASLCPFIFLGNQTFEYSGPVGRFTIFRRLIPKYYEKISYYHKFKSYSGFILPVTSCRNDSVRNTLFTLPHFLHWVVRHNDIRLSREKIQEWLSNRNAGFLQIVEKEDLDGLIQFRLTKEVFENLLLDLDYITAVYDCFPDPVRIARQEPFHWRSYGEFLSWVYGEPVEYMNWHWENFIICLVFDHIAAQRRLGWEKHVIRHLLQAYNGRLENFFQIKSDINNIDLAVNFEYQPHGWALLHISFQDHRVTILCSEHINPFEKFICWLKSIESGELPIAFTIDEEGDEKIFLAHATSDFQRIFFQIMEKYNHIVYLEAICSREHLVQTFKNALRSFLQSQPNLKDWGAINLLTDSWFQK